MAERAKVLCECGQHVANAQMKQHVTGRVHREHAATTPGATATMERPSAVIQQTHDLASQGAYLPPDGREASSYVPPRLDGAAAALEAAVAAKPLPPADAPQEPALAPAVNAPFDPRAHAAAIYEADLLAKPGEHNYAGIRVGVDASAAFMPTIKDGQPQVDLVTGGARTTVPPLVAGQRDDADPEAETAVITHTVEPHEAALKENVVDAPGSGPLGRDYNMFADRPARPTVTSMQEGAGVRRPDAAPAAPAGQFVKAGDRETHPGRVTPPAPTDEVMDDYSQALGSARYATPYVFDDPEERMRNFQGFRLKFSRFYFDQSVLVDIFTTDSAAVRNEVSEKSRAIATWNVDTPDMRFGYIPIILGVQLDFEVAVLALRGKIASLQVRQPYQ